MGVRLIGMTVRCCVPTEAEWHHGESGKLIDATHLSVAPKRPSPHPYIAASASCFPLHLVNLNINSRRTGDQTWNQYCGCRTCLLQQQILACQTFLWLPSLQSHVPVPEQC
jgi:hypothetical protein